MQTRTCLVKLAQFCVSGDVWRMAAILLGLGMKLFIHNTNIFLNSEHHLIGNMLEKYVGLGYCRKLFDFSFEMLFLS